MYSMACIGFREPALAYAGCHGSLLAGKYMKISIISRKKEDEKRTKKKNTCQWVPKRHLLSFGPLWLCGLLWVLVGFHRPALAATGPRWPTLAVVGLLWLPWVLAGLRWLLRVLVGFRGS
jgi:hypothetical protein